MAPAASPKPALARLLADLGSAVHRGRGRGDGSSEVPAPCPTGLPELDRLLGGGLPRGRLCEITGPPSSGRTSLMLALLASATAEGACAGVVDPADAFDPASARQAGVDLGRVLWVRATAWREALRCTERLLETEGFRVVVLDAASGRAGRPPSPGRTQGTWLRLARRAAATRSTLVVLSREPLTGASAEVRLDLEPAQPQWSERPSLLERLEGRAVLVRRRAAPGGGGVSLRLAAPSAA